MRFPIYKSRSSHKLLLAKNFSLLFLPKAASIILACMYFMSTALSLFEVTTLVNASASQKLPKLMPLLAFVIALAIIAVIDLRKF